MQVTSVEVWRAKETRHGLLAFANITVNGCLMIRNLKVVNRPKGLYVAMPDRRITDRCPECQKRNHLQARYCTKCRFNLPGERAKCDDRGRPKLYDDIAHPINRDCRSRISEAVIGAYRELGGPDGPSCVTQNFAERRPGEKLRISSVHVDLGSGRPKGFAKITLDDCFTIREMEVKHSGRYGYYVQLPHVKVEIPCPDCKRRNPKDAQFCNNCGVQLKVPEKLSAGDLFMPIVRALDTECDGLIERTVMERYWLQLGAQEAPIA